MLLSRVRDAMTSFELITDLTQLLTDLLGKDSLT